MKKTQQAYALKVSRPTLDKMIKAQGAESIERQAKEALSISDIYSLIKTHNTISVFELEELLEYLEDRSYLSDEGKKLRTKLWETFIKK